MEYINVIDENQQQAPQALLSRSQATMRKTAILLSIFALPLAAQRITSSTVSDESVAIGYSVPLPQPKSDYSYTVTPLLRCGANEIALPAATVRGRRNAKKLHRHIVLGGGKQAEPPYIAAGAATELTGTATLLRADYPWLNGAELQLCARIEGEGCCNIESERTECGDMLTIAPPTPPTPPVVADTLPAKKDMRPLYVLFPLDKTDIRRNFRGNGKVLDEMVDYTRQALAEGTTHHIYIMGLASPEGPMKHNQWLSDRRAEALKAYLQRELNLPDSIFTVRGGGEAWDEFREAVAASDIAERDTLLNIIDTEMNPARRERRIKALGGGKPYKWLLDNILGNQRLSGYIKVE